MQHITRAAAILICLLALSCRIQPVDIKPATPPQPITPSTAPTQLPPPNDSITRVLIDLTGLLINAPADPVLLSKLDRISFDDENKAFIVVGRGVPSPAAPTYETRLASRERAAKIMAEAAALCVKRRAHGAKIPYTFGIKGKIAWMEKIREEIRGDTLIRVFRVPEGSIIP